MNKLIVQSIIISLMFVPMKNYSQHHHEAGTEKQGVILVHFPASKSNYAEDMHSCMDQVISRHGPEEWRSAVLASELHGHLGIFAILGVKMGLFAREYFKAQVDEIEVVSHAGTQPPVSCLNDGLQVSTGATLGHGTIRVPDTKTPQAAARFTHEGNVVEIHLKKRFQGQVNEDVSSCLERYGITSDEYWKEIRRIAINYWLEWDRNEIFEVSSPEN